METIKSANELIAEFMGWERYSHNSFKCPNTYPIDNSIRNGWTTFSADQLEFESDWRLLMPVVEKIETIEDFQVTICKDFVNVSSAKGDGYHKNHSGVDKRESVYKAVVEFLKWYNQKSLTS